MNFFKDFKDDFAQAVDGLGKSKNSKEEFEEIQEEEVDYIKNQTLDSNNHKMEEDLEEIVGNFEKKIAQGDQYEEDGQEEAEEILEENAEEEEPIAEDLPEEEIVNEEVEEDIKLETRENDDQMNQQTKEVVEENSEMNITDDVSVITQGTTLKGSINTTGSIDLQGTVEGDIECNGKLVITGVINGNSSAAEIFADGAKMQGEIMCTGTVKIGAGSVVVGNIMASSVVIAGAVKGDVDVQGPVILDASAVVVGNIKSRSVQINNGAVVEGFCSQCYAEVSVDDLFGDK